MRERFSVISYSEGNLRIIFEETSPFGSSIQKENHLEYFFEYFKFVSCKTIIIEEEYIDRDFLEDFALYYVRCFKDYGRKCRRLHFFSSDFCIDDFSAHLKSRNFEFENILKSSYLGFTVLKKLPQTIIGRTCLISYPQEGGRFFTIIEQYSANLFGIDLNVHSLPFQEQDSVVAACATSALWSAFHKTGKMFQHPIPSPALITKQASELTSYGMGEKRDFPNHGLTVEQMAYAVKKISLEPLLFSTDDTFSIKANIFAYLNNSIPIILIFELYDIVTNEGLGLHAVTIAGYKLEDIVKSKSTSPTQILKSNFISKIYVHDDQIGPFARMGFTDKIIKEGEKKSPLLTTSWKDNNGDRGNVFAIPRALLIPVYHKIRIPLQFVYEKKVSGFMDFISLIANFISADGKLIWVIKLETTNSYKNAILESTILSEPIRIKLLTESLPHYIWIVSCVEEEKPLFDLIFDATDLEQADSLIDMVEFDPNVIRVIKKSVRIQDAIDPYITPDSREVFHRFL